MKRPNITPGDWTLEPAMGKQDCGLRIHTPESAAYGMAHIYSPGANAEANAVAMTAVPALLEALERIAGWEPTAAPDEPGGMSIMESIDIAQNALARAGYSFP